MMMDDGCDDDHASCQLTAKQPDTAARAREDTDRCPLSGSGSAPISCDVQLLLCEQGPCLILPRVE